MIKLVWHDLPAIYPCWLIPITVNLYILKKIKIELQTNCKWTFWKEIPLEFLPPVVISVGMEHSHCGVVLGMGWTKSEPGTSGGMTEPSLQRGQPQPRIPDSFQRETQHKELSLAQDTQSGIYLIWFSTDPGEVPWPRERGADPPRSFQPQTHHCLPIKLLNPTSPKTKKAIEWPNCFLQSLSPAWWAIMSFPTGFTQSWMQLPGPGSSPACRDCCWHSTQALTGPGVQFQLCSCPLVPPLGTAPSSQSCLPSHLQPALPKPELSRGQSSSGISLSPLGKDA